MKETGHASGLAGRGGRGAPDAASVYETWRGLYEAMGDGVGILDREGTILDANGALIEMFGHPKHELVGRPGRMLADPERFDLDATRERLRRAWMGKAQRFTWWCRRKDGEAFPTEVTLNKGRFFGRDVVVAMARDVSLRFARQRAVEASEARYRATFEVARDGLVIVDAASLEVRSANARAVDILIGVQGDASSSGARFGLEGEGLVRLLRGYGVTETETETATEAELRRILGSLEDTGGHAGMPDWCVVHEDGALRWVDLDFARFDSPGYHPVLGRSQSLVLVAIHDITERKRSAEALRAFEERERVAERLRALGELSAGVAHNFNNALTSILAHAQILVRSPAVAEGVREDLQVIERVAREAAVTVRRIQSFARNRDPEALELIDFGDVVANAVALTRPRWQPGGDGGKWRFELEARPLAANAKLLVHGNAAELCEVLVNLILNGLDAMPEGGRMWVRTGVEGDRVYAEVEDTGSGMDEETQRRLFDPFFSTKGASGMGLGLSVSHGIVRRHRGEISLVSAPGQGTRFLVCLPRVDGELDEAEVEALPRARPSTILVVDDDPTVRRAVGQMLGELGHAVVSACDGREALTCLDAHREVGLLLTDLAMPVLDGSGLLREVSRRWPQLPTVLMTGLAAEADPRAVEAAGALLRKPLELASLERTLARLIPADPEPAYAAS